MKVGFIGLGAMGSAMASNLIAAGHAVTVWNRSAEACAPLASLGARVASTPERAAQGEVLCSMLADDRAVRAVFFDGGLLDAMDPGTVHVNHATLSVELTRELAAAHAQRGLDYVAAPVFGRPEMAAAAKLSIVAAGKAEAIETVQPLLQAMGARTWLLGEAPERAAVVKIAGNFMLASAIESMAEATALTRAHGVSAADFLEVVTSNMFATPAYQVYGKMIAEQRFKPAGFALPLGYKDVGLALAAGDAARVPLPFAGVLRDSLLEALAAGDEDMDWSALSLVAARRAHLDKRGN
ncbi:NAD(P)-dependent oxidoreductase [Rhodanobacter sp. AS-Z3]|uniref:NAD(P)-dependent oxidoreductase n=1 Tax=Rhodanobacter sp. AS-Z3 TaxID=3031330 RepID=UPI002478E4D4|nr:NAD(P)-dependent oxidoreductase [Rhodanobacter sp. AS-Z3]WEN14401.1 NAD(P)-dependent oxidoreductase [Rhodanobacter sp. AS-Z3]